MRVHTGCRRRPHPTGTREAARRTRTSPSGGMGEVGEAELAHTTTSPCKLGRRGGKTSPHYVPSVELFRVRVRARVAAARESAARRTQGNLHLRLSMARDARESAPKLAEAAVVGTTSRVRWTSGRGEAKRRTRPSTDSLSATTAHICSPSPAIRMTGPVCFIAQSSWCFIQGVG